MKWGQLEGPNFRLQVPEKWKKQSSPKFQVAFVAPIDIKDLPPNLAITMRRVKEDVTIPAVSNQAKKTQSIEYPQYKLLEEDPGKGVDNQGLTNRYQWYHPKRSISMVQQQTFFLKNQILYTLTATRPEAIESAQEMDQVFENMVASFSANTED